ncbi:hypothetical protein SAMN04487785_11772 [Dyella jiangningensis]|uniref:hypothetical protein n=1 Tax=Dyella sp. AtDHG13 TaxID=1938897 RepID=UPI00088F542F|nr:hypothetical protein [Dyella sp. AtDHG13]PXV59010.1 hypothetical protein BDW41_10454 [Dyella sp. AtDHG13]SDL29726.1 hypothetical protein SAMN04487785_11772 [Dyella jiangningensis]
MNIQPRKTALYCATLAGLLVLSACGKNQEASNTTPTAPTSSAPAPAVPAPVPPATAPAPERSAPSPTSTAPAPAQTTGKSASVNGGAIRVAAVTIGSQVDAGLAISKEQRQFAPEDKAIYASVATIGTSDNATLNAQWSYLEGKDETFSTTTESIATDGPAVTTFKVQNPNAWPKGKYKVVISLNGKPVASEGFEVRG